MIDLGKRLVEYRLAKHAAHYGKTGGGHDLEVWTCEGSSADKRPEGVPANAEYHHGFQEGGRSFRVFVRIAPMSPGACK